MLSKLFIPLHHAWKSSFRVVGPRKRGPLLISVRRIFDVPPSQYDIPLPNKLNIFYVMRVYWETIPLFFTTGFAFGVLACAIMWACKNKVDVVFTPHSRANISRTMDLRHPTIHKVLVFNQKYEPWPEMQDVLDKMRDAEKRALLRGQACSNP